MRYLKRKRTLSLVALAAAFLLRPLPAFADDANGLPTPPPAKTGIEGKIEDVTINGMTFKQGRQVITISSPNFVTVGVEIYAPEGVGARLNSQRHTIISYWWAMTPLADGMGGMQLTESITVNSTLENKDTGKATTDRDDRYEVETDWERASGKAGAPYALHQCKAKSDWMSETGSTGNFSKFVGYFNAPAADGLSFVKSQVVYVSTNFFVADPLWGDWKFSRQTSWDDKTGNVTKHTVSINGDAWDNPFAFSMIEAVVVAGGMNPQITDPSVPALTVPPLEWPQQP